MFNYNLMRWELRRCKIQSRELQFKDTWIPEASSEFIREQVFAKVIEKVNEENLLKSVIEQQDLERF